MCFNRDCIFKLFPIAEFWLFFFPKSKGSLCTVLLIGNYIRIKSTNFRRILFSCNYFRLGSQTGLLEMMPFGGRKSVFLRSTSTESRLPPRAFGGRVTRSATNESRRISSWQISPNVAEAVIWEIRTHVIQSVRAKAISTWNGRNT